MPAWDVHCHAIPQPLPSQPSELLLHPVVSTCPNFQIHNCLRDFLHRMCDLVKCENGSETIWVEMLMYDSKISMIAKSIILPWTGSPCPQLFNKCSAHVFACCASGSFHFTGTKLLPYLVCHAFLRLLWAVTHAACNAGVCWPLLAPVFPSARPSRSMS